jgi:aminopeptidase-like protein
MSTMMELINELWFLKRDIISDGYDKALHRLSTELPIKIHKYQTGEKCWTWTIPEKWTCDEAYLETLDGKRLIDYTDHPLHVVSYSLPFERIISREELLPHLHTHKRLPDAIPFVFKYYERDWGLCFPENQKQTLQDEEYKVVIRSRFEPGELKVGEWIIPGKSEQSFVLAAHLCHPAMVNDDLTGVVVALETAKKLMAAPKPNYTYRFLILPETIGSIAWLSHNEGLIPVMVGGLFLETLGHDAPLTLQHSFMPESQADRCVSAALLDFDPGCRFGDYRRVVDNDERQFNSPGVRVPMLSLSRVMPDKTDPEWPFHEYHSSLDTPAIIKDGQLDRSVDTVLGLIQAWERNQYPINQFKGEVFCSGNNIWIDHQVNPQGHRRLFEIMERCDGSRTVADIASELEITFNSVWEVISLLVDRKLISFSRQKNPTDPMRGF